MRRRDFIILVGGAVALPLAAGAQQQPAMPLVGVMTSSAASARSTAAFREGLKQAGFVEGNNVALDYRSAEGQVDRVPAIVSDLVGRSASVLGLSTSGALAAKQAGTAIPVVFTSAEDPVKLGLVASLNRPGGNFTGIYLVTGGLEAKRLGLLHEMVPKATTIAVLIDPNFPAFDSQLRDLHESAARLQVQLVVAHAKTERDFGPAFSTFVQNGAQALVVCATPLFYSRRQQLVVLAAHHRLPAIYEWRDFAEAGGLMSYGTSLAEAYRQQGVYAGRILKGEKPADLPVMQLARFEFVINLATARTLGLEVPGAISAHADEVIE
jgi:putative ABC transport system substrate-binding protein